MAEKKKKKEMEQEYVKMMLENNLFAVIYPKDKSEESAQKIAEITDSAVGVAEFQDDNGNLIWGVLIDKIKENEKRVKLNSSIESDNEK